MTDLSAEFENLPRFRFGDSRDLCEELTALVLAGRKTGTCWAHRDAANGEPLLAVGDRAVYTDWDGAPVCVVEYTQIRICRFDAVTEAFALSEGEGDYDAWRNGHIAWFGRTGGWSPDMLVVCENFRVVEAF